MNVIIILTIIQIILIIGLLISLYKILKKGTSSTIYPIIAISTIIISIIVQWNIWT